MSALGIFCLLSLLLIIGKGLRSFIPVLRFLYLPSSVIGGLVGLCIISIFPNLIPPDWLSAIRTLPGFLINIVFAALFLGEITPKLKKIINIAFPQFCFGQMTAWGQYVVGLGITGLLLIPLFSVSDGFGNLLEIGFEGGHGTVGGMSSAFTQFHWSDGIALGYTLATIGMILGIVIGIVLINWASKKGHLSHIRKTETGNSQESLGVYTPKNSPNAGKQTVFSDSIDSLAWHIALIGLAICLGWGLLEGLIALETAITHKTPEECFFRSFPLFPLCMIGGIILQKISEKVKLEHLIDHGQMKRLSGASLDFLVVSAVMTIRLDVVSANWLPLLILIIVGSLWSIFMVVWVGPRLFKEAWFERSIAEFGQSMGVTATGLLLLRTVDPEAKTVAPEAFGYKQLLHEPIMGGGLWTALAFTLVFTCGLWTVWIICLGIFLLWCLIAWKLSRKK